MAETDLSLYTLLAFSGNRQNKHIYIQRKFVRYVQLHTCKWRKKVLITVQTTFCMKQK